MSACRNCGAPSAPSARFCSWCGAPLAGVTRPPPTTRTRKVVTVLFADVIGFTTLAEQLDPEPLHEVMERWFADADAAIERHGGHIAKHIGDAVMALFGVPVVHEDDALRAARAAREMCGALDDLNEELARRWNVRLQVRTGINTGEVMVTEEPDGAPAVLGDPVNVAQRLEGAAEPGQILIGEQTAQLLRGVARLTQPEELELKGKSEPVIVARLVDVEPEAGDGREDFATPLVGREAELEQLRGAFADAVASGEPRMVTVIGPAGIGKSRLIRAVLDGVGGEATTAVGRCLPYGESITYWPLTEIADCLAGGGRLRALASEGHSSVEETQRAVRHLFEAAARTEPLLVVFEDIQWATPTLLDLIEHVAEAASDVPLMIVCLARPELAERRPDWHAAGGDRASVLRLAPLTDDESRALLGQLGGLELSPDESARLLATAEGNPLFLQQMVASRAETPEATIAGSPTIQALLTARIDRLDHAERAVLERGAVEGRTFHPTVLVDLLRDEEGLDLDGALAALRARDLIRPSRPDFPGERAFRFSHILIRDVAYALMPKQRRAHLHERLARWFERRGGRGREPPAEVIGYHLEQSFALHVEVEPAAARSYERLATGAARYLGAAGRRALARDDLPAAIGLLERAHALMPADQDERGLLAADLGIALTDAGRLEDAERTLAAAIAEANTRDDELGRAHCLVASLGGRLMVDTEETSNEVRERFDLLVATFEAANDHLGLDRLWRLRGLVHWVGARSGEAEAAWERAAEHAQRAGDEGGRADALSWLASSAYFGPTPVSEAIARCELIAKQLEPDSRDQAAVFESLAGLHAMRAEFDTARELLARTNAILADLGRALQSAVSHPEAYVALASGDAERAERTLRAGYERLAEMGERAILASTAATLARALVELDRPDEAWRFTEEAEQAAAPDDLSAQISWRCERARLVARRGDASEAQRIAAEAVSLAAQTDWLSEHGDALVAQAEVLQRGGEPDAAAQALREAIALYERKGNEVGARRAHAMLAMDVPA